jgi:hypothetical protein
VGDLEGSIVAAAHSGERGRVVVLADPARGRSGLLQRQQISRGERRSGRQGERGPIEEVAACNGLFHASLPADAPLKRKSPATVTMKRSPDSVVRETEATQSDSDDLRGERPPEERACDQEGEQAVEPEAQIVE